MTAPLARMARRLRELPPRLVVSKAFKRLGDARFRLVQRRADAKAETYASGATGMGLSHFLSVPNRVMGFEWLEPLCEHYGSHRFDVLGSGWSAVAHGVSCAGLEGITFEAAEPPTVDSAGGWLTDRVTEANLAESRRVWSLVAEDYVPIDWHLDLKSGYRWPETVWYRDIPVAPALGVDIKVPWELARCQHLPQMALLVGWSDQEGRDRIANEFRNQVCDFIATNPPRFGVNWFCAMDVGIRIANWLLARDLLCAAGVRFDEQFDVVFARSVLEHGRHIRHNLEGDAELRNNHYLANLVGLLFCSAYLSRDAETEEWWTFASRGLIGEINEQFLDDGGCFEGSTSYHRLSAEMVTWGVALIVRIEGTHAVPPNVVARLERMAEFVRDVAMPSGKDPQFGDNDSGRLFKLGVRYQWASPIELAERYANLKTMDAEAGEAYWLEEQRDHRHIIGSVAGLLARTDLGDRSGDWIDGQLLVDLAANKLQAVAQPDVAARVRIGGDGEWSTARSNRDGLDADRCVVQSWEISPETGVMPHSTCGYPDFGLYILRSTGLYVAIRCGSVGQNGLGGHAHNDQLGVVLEIDGRPQVQDPGSYLYTPLPARRNEYRSARAHNVPLVAGLEPASLEFDLFRLGDPGAQCLYFGDRGFVGYHDGYGARVWRMVELTPGSVMITDWCEDPAVHLIAPGTVAIPTFSPGYGWRERELGAR